MYTLLHRWLLKNDAPDSSYSALDTAAAAYSSAYNLLHAAAPLHASSLALLATRTHNSLSYGRSDRISASTRSVKPGMAQLPPVKKISCHTSDAHVSSGSKPTNRLLMQHIPVLFCFVLPLGTTEESRLCFRSILLVLCQQCLAGIEPLVLYTVPYY
jgi:hypothetical protein